jgi:nucleoside-diphosphate-sugar epimerase
MPDETVLVTGGAGYVGSVLVPNLLTKGYSVKVLDLYLYGVDVLGPVAHNEKLTQIKGDIRDEELLRESLAGVDSVIHLACISNDPSFELDPELSKSINFDAFEPLVRIAKESGVRRFVYASTCSVYGISDQPNVTEDHPLLPITDYNKYKGLCEPILLDAQSPEFTTVVIRPATVCGYSPRQRMDLAVNILTNLAYNNGKVTVFGGDQMRPNVHINDIVDLYTMLLELPDEQIAGKTFNAGNENLTVQQMADIVVEVVGRATETPIEVVTTPSDDIRSYHISSEKIRRELGWIPKRTVADGVQDLVDAFKDGMLPGSLDDEKYFNIKLMQDVKLT